MDPNVDMTLHNDKSCVFGNSSVIRQSLEGDKSGADLYLRGMTRVFKLQWLVPSQRAFSIRHWNGVEILT